MFYLKIITVLHDDNGAEECLYFSIPSDAACCPDVGDVLCSLAVLSLLMGAHTSHCTGTPDCPQSTTTGQTAQSCPLPTQHEHTQPPSPHLAGHG